MHQAVIAAALKPLRDPIGTMSLQPISHSIDDNVRRIRAQLDEAARGAGRNPDSVRLIAVAKTKPAAQVRAAVAAGCADIGESYLQEALPKMAALADLNVRWHYIGAIQSNKTRAIAEGFDWVHTVSRPKIAERLSDHCPSGRTLNVTLQVNVDRDPAKAGVDPDEAAALLERVQQHGNLRVRGLMTILRQDSPPEAGYRRLAELFHTLRGQAAGPWDTLSMGMSGDFREAVAAGATHVRIGTAIFGRRSRP